MATVANTRITYARTELFWLVSAALMTAVIVAGFSLQLAMHRSSFAVPPLIHLHAILFFGWTLLYLIQNVMADRADMRLHRRLGWLAVLLVPAMVVVGTTVTVGMVRRGGVPFFFTPLYFLIMNPVSILIFAGLTMAAIVKRRSTQWHRRLMFCGMAMLTGPAFGRLLPMPLLIPVAGWAVFAAVMLFPLAGVVRELRRGGKIHPAWRWGIATMIAAQLSMDLIAHSAVGDALYRWTTAGSPGASRRPLDYPPFPGA